MKFYQIIAPAILSIIYTATIFGPDLALPCVPEDIYNLIDEFCGGENKGREQKLNDRYYKETGHLKPASRLLNLLMSLTLEQAKQRLSKNFLQFTISLASFFIVTPILYFKTFSALSGKPLAVISSMQYALFVAFSTDSIIGHMLTKIANRFSHSHLIIEYPKKITIKSNINRIDVLSRQSKNIIETRLLSNMQLIDITQPSRGTFERQYSLTRPKPELPYKLNEEGIIDTYLSNNDYKLGAKYKLCSLSTPARLISSDVSENEDTIVALDEEGSLHKWKLRNRPSLHEIMDSE